MNSIPVTIRFTSDWGVGTGTGYAGGVDSVVEVDENNRPVVCGTAVTGVIREQALTVARALDGGRSGRWHDFIGSLFGGAPNFGDADEDRDRDDPTGQSDKPSTSADQTVPRAIVFSDAHICEEAKAPDGAEANTKADAEVAGNRNPAENSGVSRDDDTAKVTEVVSVSIDEKTGTAKPDHFRIIERAPACVLKGRVDFVDPEIWNESQDKTANQIDAAKFVLALAGTLVPAIGSEKTNGDGRCEITVGDFLDDVGLSARGDDGGDSLAVKNGEFGDSEAGGSADSGEGDSACSDEDDSACSDEDADRSLSPVEIHAKAAHAACKEWLQEKLKELEETGSPSKAPDAVRVSASGESPCIGCAEKADPSKQAEPKGQADQQGQAESKEQADGRQADGRADSPSYRSFDLNIELKTPVVSYEVPMSNEVRSLDFLRGTVVLAWVHSRLRAKFPADETIRNAVVNGELFVSDATACVGGVRGRPVPMVFSYPKVVPSESGGRPDQSTRELWNRLVSKEPEDVHVPVRSGYIFDFGDGESGKPRYGTGAPPVTGRQSTAHDAVRGTAKDGQLFLVRALAAGLTLQSTVTITESLYKHRPTAANNLCEHQPGEPRNETRQVSQRTLGEMLPEILQGQARLGSRRLAGTFGLAECKTTEKYASDGAAAARSDAVGGNGTPAGGNAAAGNGAIADVHVRANLDDNANTGNTDGWDSEGATTIWFTSDLLLRSPSLGAAGSSTDIIDAFNRSDAFNSADARIEPFSPEKTRKDGTAASKQGANNGMTPPKRDASTSSSKCDDGTLPKQDASDCEGDHRYRAGLRYRRVDSWSAAEGQPRATRLAVQAGSVLKVCLGDKIEQRRKALAALRELETVGIGELRAQGFGRFVVGDPLLSIRDNDGKGFHVKLLHSNDFLSDEK
ncbi:hypothetical protein A4H34_03355 [Peptidiphaga gingivicola]|uniref:CRISPR type III-associated protein domain-containing protein n=1 Tax=Peptidiphaga gingivicola TaxID=2741497 RepID=A0A179B446_9ACTO|nr:RAMP superfamily CRISPR-associated protein [Peptidiphaga gingivicola]OAP86220.1 hypothetical protein A4H34_03355 [Peptidiphaga gingivicola]